MISKTKNKFLYPNLIAGFLYFAAPVVMAAPGDPESDPSTELVAVVRGAAGVRAEPSPLKLDELPHEVLVHISSYLRDPKHIAALKATNRVLYTAAQAFEARLQAELGDRLMRQAFSGPITEDSRLIDLLPTFLKEPTLAGGEPLQLKLLSPQQQADMLAQVKTKTRHSTLSNILESLAKESSPAIAALDQRFQIPDQVSDALSQHCLSQFFRDWLNLSPEHSYLGIALEHLFGDYKLTGTAAMIEAYKANYSELPDLLRAYLEQDYISVRALPEEGEVEITQLNVVVEQEDLNDEAILQKLESHFAAKPEHTLVLNLSGAHVSHLIVPATLKQLAVVNTARDLKLVGHGFLFACEGLTKLNLSGLRNVTRVGDEFLSYCTGLTELDLTGLGKVTQVGNSFLAGCKGLTELDLTSLDKVTEIGNQFLSGCRGLTKLSLAGLHNVTLVGDEFLAYCNSLTELDLTSLNNVTQVGNSFLANCAGLTELSLTSLGKVTKIGNQFLSGCHGLTELDLTGLLNVTRVGYSFLNHCAGLTELDLTGLSSVTEIGDGFLFACEGLTKLNLSGLRNVTRVGDEFLAYCNSLTELDLTGLGKVTRVGNHFLFYCYRLTELDLTSLGKVTRVGNEFLSYCPGLTELDLTSLSNVTQIGNRFLANCSGLTELDLTSLRNVTQVGDEFLSYCTGLTELDLTSLSKVTQVGNEFLSGCIRVNQGDKQAFLQKIRQN